MHSQGVGVSNFGLIKHELASKACLVAVCKSVTDLRLAFFWPIVWAVIFR